jgi:acetyl esterase/lipase
VTATATSTEVRVIPDLTYAVADGVELKLDLHLPAPHDDACPVVLYLHGGGFMVGTRKAFAQERFAPAARAGIAVASAEYRFTDVATHPAQIHDAKAAVRWLRANAARYGWRRERIGVWGASAGGYLALMLGVTAGVPAFEGTLGDHGDQSSAVQAVTAWFPITDVLAADTVPVPAGRELPPFVTEPPPEPSRLARLLGVRRVSDHPELAAVASPISYAGSTQAAFLLMHGDADGLTSETQSIVMHEALVTHGVVSTLLLLAGANHEGSEFDGAASLGAVTGFFRGVL